MDLLSACREGKLEVVETLLLEREGEGQMEVDQSRRGPLHFLVRRRKRSDSVFSGSEPLLRDLITLLLEKGMDKEATRG